MTMPDWHPVALAFEVTEDRGAPVDGHNLSITSVVRDDYGIRVNYEIVPPLVSAVFGPGGVAADDLGNRYEDAGGTFGLDPDRGRTDGALTMPLPAFGASRLVVRFRWDELDSLWEGRAHELRIALTGQAETP
ncbi:MAG: hypothetical protein QOJ29_3178 [Thermoleophilaceae bacterium]|jgi:hypothetical protein|nr:hypothetical protein [Thermoleophilaceae bacterium]